MTNWESWRAEMRTHNDEVARLLGEKSRRAEALWLRFCGRKYREIAEFMGISRWGVWSHLTEKADLQHVLGAASRWLSTDTEKAFRTWLQERRQV